MTDTVTMITLHPQKESQPFTLMERAAMGVARWPKTCLLTSISLCLLCSSLGLYYGDFTVSVDTAGWFSRGSLIGNRQQQTWMIRKKRDGLVAGDEAFWDDLTENVQPSFQTQSGRRLLTVEEENGNDASPQPTLNDVKPLFHRHLNELQADGNETDGILALVEHCDLDLYSQYKKRRLWPKWKVTNSEASALDPEILHDLCVAEENTQKVLEEQGLCFGCGDYGCLPPYSIVLYARLEVPRGFSMTCRDLADSWAPYQSQTEDNWQNCVGEMTSSGTSLEGPMPASCQASFTPALVDKSFQSTGRVAYTSSVFMTKDDAKKDLYEISGLYDRGSANIEGVFDTQYEDFVEMYANDVLPQDMILAAGSALITAVAVLIHTRSLFITGIGLLQILLSFPMAFCVYRFLGNLTYFPFLNFVGVFVIFALGADHIFVAVDKWKNARIENEDATTEEIAAKALPDAAQAMLLTSLTTAVAFFASAICPVAPIKLFSIFCGLLISLDYIMDVLILFPALCIYDGFRSSNNCFVNFGACNTGKKDLGESKNNEDGPSLIHRILSRYYGVLHKFRWVSLVACVAAIGVCSYFATKLHQPVSNDLRVLNSSTEYERAHEWKSKLLIDVLQQQSGGTAYVVFGVAAADTGNHNDPSSWTTLELDETFDPSTEPAQIFLRDYCDRFLSQDFAKLNSADYVCAINNFDNWLQKQATAEVPDDTYQAYCAGETGMPLSQDAFHPCLSAWAQKVNEKFISSRNGIVKIIHFPFTSNIQHSSPNSKIRDEWHAIEDWMQRDNANAPDGISRPFFSSIDFLFWDTNYQMFTTAVSSAGIAILAAAVVILISSRSVAMTVFSVISVGYVLASVTSMMVAAGWEFGLLESICFTILIGISVDFVVHFSHTYAETPGQVSRHQRTKHALIHMGPSILAAAFTTLASALIMLFTKVLFFNLFASVMVWVIIQATLGSFVIFLTLTDTMGPSNPTMLFDSLTSQCRQEIFVDASLVGAETDSDSILSSSESGDEYSISGPREDIWLEIEV